MTTPTEALIAEAAKWIEDKLPPEPWAADHIVKRLAATLEATLPRTVATVAELDALPEGSVIKDKYNDVMQLRGRLWCGYESVPFPTDYVARKYLPATVLYTPEATS